MSPDTASKFSYASEGSTIYGDSIYPEEMEELDKRVIEWRAQVVLEGTEETGAGGPPTLLDSEDGAQSALVGMDSSDSAPGVALSIDVLFDTTTSAFEFDRGYLSGRSSVASSDAHGSPLRRSSFEIAPPAHEVPALELMTGVHNIDEGRTVDHFNIYDDRAKNVATRQSESVNEGNIEDGLPEYARAPSPSQLQKPRSYHAPKDTETPARPTRPRIAQKPSFGQKVQEKLRALRKQRALEKLKRGKIDCIRIRSGEGFGNQLIIEDDDEQPFSRVGSTDFWLIDLLAEVDDAGNANSEILWARDEYFGWDGNCSADDFATGFRSGPKASKGPCYTMPMLSGASSPNPGLTSSNTPAPVGDSTDDEDVTIDDILMLVTDPRDEEFDAKVDRFMEVSEFSSYFDSSSWQRDLLGDGQWSEVWC
ncbi:uncharacterized protein SCHCODRAFT_02546790 [Schizophyllum commune H4-8]|uniref:Uncharacterized protein n=1 Tax=Schizophyllum commune (strain H4-8 / FGSC 9210) TaxID=578458 RepID=D8Q9R2_SCHCM|nr:uncharacterized protein SCHCODRAFT_02546790 [Schizophyllum commune H4-8]KAI5890319.1 hypothetical protein SCHCODRAFT_02546790 [Schizophyllum commune H4-8]